MTDRIERFATIKRRVRVRRSRKVRPGRLKGKALSALRAACFDRDGGICVGCGFPVDPSHWHMAHVRGKRMWGDSLDNVKTMHPYCHLVGEHNPKSVPRKAALSTAVAASFIAEKDR